MGIIIPANHAHIDVLADIHVQGWKEAYRGTLNPTVIDALSVDEKKDQWQKWIDDSDSQSFLYQADEASYAGFITVGKMRTAPPGTSKIRPIYTGEIYAIYLRKEYWRQGIGKKLMQHGVEHLIKDGHKSACLWVVERNKNACQFYAHLGGQKLGKIQADIGPDGHTQSVKEACYGWRNNLETLF